MRELGLLDEALKSYRLALSHNPDYPETLNDLGVALFETGQLNDAVKSFEKAITINPHNADTYLNLSEVFKNLEEKDFYFVNSYHFKVKEKKFVIAESTYQHKFCSVVRKKNIIGVQFHPEKSQHAGKKFIQNFLEIK